jgi:multicomponent Na+:H+ antiporter subunit E
LYQGPKPGFHARRGSVSVTALGSLTLVFVAAWLLWSGIYKPLVLALGVFSVALSVYLAYRMNFFSHLTGLPRLMWRLPGFWLWLLKDIVISSWEVARIVLSPSLPISPTTVLLDLNTSEELPQVILGNAITLSPGTVTLDIDDGRLLVHCITKAGAENLSRGELVQRVARLEQPQ